MIVILSVRTLSLNSDVKYLKILINKILNSFFLCILIGLSIVEVEKNGTILKIKKIKCALEKSRINRIRCSFKSESCLSLHLSVRVSYYHDINCSTCTCTVAHPNHLVEAR